MSMARVTSPFKGRWFGLLVCLSLFVSGGVVRADPSTAEAPALPGVFEKAVPEGVKDLQAIQQHVKSLLKKTMPATVGIQVGAAQGSGVIVTKDGFVLTAGHVSGAPERKCRIIMPDGRILTGKTLGANHGIDSGMIQITDKGEFPFVEMAKSADLKPGHWCLAIGHPGGWQKGRDPVVRLGRIQSTGKTFLQSDCALVGGDSGGPLFDMHGKVIGIHSRIGGPITANIHVPVDTYRDTWERLAKAEEWGNNPLFNFAKNAEAYMGLSLDPESKECKIVEVTVDSPAAKAGLKINDIVRQFDGKKIATQEDLLKLMQTKRPGNEVALEVLRGAETITLRVTLGKRPG